MKILIHLFCLICIVCAIPAFAQGPGGEQQGAAQAWMRFEKELGMQTTYSVDMVMQTMGMNMTTRTIRDGGKTRTEMTLPMMNLKMVALEIPEGSYSIFPEKKKYVLNAGAEQARAAMPAPVIEDLGTEAYEGENCLKRGVTMVQEGVTSKMIMLISPRQKNMPVKMTVTANISGTPVQSVILFKNYNFSRPDGSLFAIPAGYAPAASMQEIMMESMPDMDSMMQQLQQMAPAE